jgi:hypothetical protein
MAAAKERLDQLLKLAAERRWPVLARELTDLVLAWPQDYPPAMRAPVMALLEAALRQSDETTRAELAARMGGHPELPLRLLNTLYLDAPAPLRREILMRNELEAGGEDETPADAAGLLAAARNGTRDFAGALGRSAAIPRDVAQAILGEASGEALAVLCRGTGLDRATFSAVALLRGVQDMPLGVFDSVPDHAAARLVHDWRAHNEAPVAGQIRAAE